TCATCQRAGRLRDKSPAGIDGATRRQSTQTAFSNPSLRCDRNVPPIDSIALRETPPLPDSSVRGAGGVGRGQEIVAERRQPLPGNDDDGGAEKGRGQGGRGAEIAAGNWASAL